MTSRRGAAPCRRGKREIPIRARVEASSGFHKWFIIMKLTLSVKKTGMCCILEATPGACARVCIDSLINCAASFWR